MTKQIDYQNFKSVTTAGHVIEQIRADILWNHGEQAKRLMSVEVRNAKIQALHGVLNTLILQEMKMNAWQDMKGSEKITGDLYKQLANGDLFEADKALQGQGLPAVDKGAYLEVEVPGPRFCEQCEMVVSDCVCIKFEEETCNNCERPVDPQFLAGLCENCEKDNEL